VAETTGAQGVGGRQEAVRASWSDVLGTTETEVWRRSTGGEFDAWELSWLIWRNTSILKEGR
jgi:hypothetical protein